MSEKISIQKKDLQNLYKRLMEPKCDKKLFAAEMVKTFGEDAFKPLLVTERLKTFEDACRELGEDNPLVVQYEQIEAAYRGDGYPEDLVAYLKLRIVCAALNEGWKPSFKEDEERWYPWHWLYTQIELDNMSDDEKQERSIISTDDYKTDFCGFGCADTTGAPPASYARIGSRLCFKSRKLALYAGRQFIELYADFNLIIK